MPTGGHNQRMKIGKFLLLIHQPLGCLLKLLVSSGFNYAPGQAEAWATTIAANASTPFRFLTSSRL
jgi:hypothetical protein